jgi:uncharacterized protein DUF2332
VTQADGDAAAVARTYREFGRHEARGRSAAYQELAEAVAGDAALVGFIASLPPDKRQPNLLFAAACYLLGAPPAIGPLRELARRSNLAGMADLTGGGDGGGHVDVPGVRAELRDPEPDPYLRRAR